MKEIKSVANYLFSSFFANGSFLVVSFLLIRFVSDTVYAELELFVVYSQIIFVFFSLNLPGSVLRFKSEYDDIKDYIKYSHNIIFFGFILLFIVILFTFLVLEFNKKYEFITLSSDLILYVPLAFIFLYSNQWIQAFYTSIYKVNKYRNYQIKVGILKIFSILLLVLFFDDISPKLKLSFDYLFLISLVLFTFYFIGIKINIKNFKSDIRKSALFSIPLVLYLLFNNLLNYSDQLFISNFFDLTDLAEYSIAYRLGLLLLIFYTALSNHYSVKFYEHYKNRIENFKETRNLVLLIIIFTCLAIIFSDFTVNLITGWEGEKLKRTSLINILIIVSYYLNILFLLYSRKLYYEGKSIKISLLVIVTGCLNIILNWLFLEKMGYEFAAITTLISFLFIAIVSFYYYYNEDRYFFKKLIKLYFSGLVMIIFISSIKYALN